ncbi:hypothetical protein GP486_008057, partial [Trichoglossum hirsutum]
MAQPSPLQNLTVSSPTSETQDAIITTTPTTTIQNLPIRNSRRSSGSTTAPNTPALLPNGRKPSGSFSKNFRFPGSPLSQRSQTQDSMLDDPISPKSDPTIAASSTKAYSPRSPEDTIVGGGGGGVGSIGVGGSSSGLDHTPPITRILSASSINGTPRSSGEFYSMSNNSTETLASEYVPQVSSRLLPRPPHVRRTSNLAPTSGGSVSGNSWSPEALMMGYVQIMGSFTLDGSLINQAPFEEVKRKGVVSGQAGGGVVGVDTGRRDNGLLGALGWGSIGESIGGLLGGGELSSIKQMRSIANSKAIPLITTPQSILFVNLQLAPGESKSYSYSFKLPRGLPPTHKGKAIKISYSLVIGTQRATTKGKELHVQQ